MDEKVSGFLAQQFVILVIQELGYCDNNTYNKQNSLDTFFNPVWSFLRSCFFLTKGLFLILLIEQSCGSRRRDYGFSILCLLLKNDKERLSVSNGNLLSA